VRLIPHLKLKHTTVCNLTVFDNGFICPSTVNSVTGLYLSTCTWCNDVQWVASSGNNVKRLAINRNDISYCFP
jgi:hypothetical protein